MKQRHSSLKSSIKLTNLWQDWQRKEREDTHYQYQEWNKGYQYRPCRHQEDNNGTLWTTLEKAMAPHSSTFAWKIPWTEEPGRLQSMGSLRVRHDRATSLSLFTFMHWIRTWQPTPVFLPGECQGRGSLVGCRLWGRTELDATEAT